MTRRPKRTEPALSAPDLIGPVSILDWPLLQGGEVRRHARRILEHAHLEVDLVPAMERNVGVPILRQIELALREAQVVEEGDLLSLTAGALHAFSAAGYRRVDHWEVRPGGWLPLRGGPRGPQVRPVNQFLAAMQFDQWTLVRGARELAIRLSSPRGLRAELIVRRVHRERHHTLSIDVTGLFRKSHLEELSASLRRHLRVVRCVVTAFRFASV
jgi:hypothetical protein